MITYFSTFFGFALITSITATCFAAAKVTTMREESRYLQEEPWRGVVHYLLFLAFSCPSCEDSLCSLMGGQSLKL